MRRIVLRTRFSAIALCLLAATHLVVAEEISPTPKRAAARARASAARLPNEGRAQAVAPVADEAQAPTALSASIAVPPPIDFQPGKTSLDTLLGTATVELSGPSSVMPWRTIRPVDTLGLADAASLALDFSREIKAAEARVEQAESQVGQARGALGPSVIYTHAGGREESSPASVTDPATNAAKLYDLHRRTDQTIAFKQPLFDPGSYSEVQRRKQLVEARRSSLQGTRGDEYMVLVQSFLSLASARLGVQLAQDYEKQLTELLDYVSRRAEAGVATDADMQRVRARNLMARAARIEQEGLFDASLVEFSRLTNVLPKQLRLPTFVDLGFPMPASAADAIDVGMVRSPEIATLKAQFEAADWDKITAKSRFSPRLDFEISDTKVTNAGGPVGLQHDHRAMVSMSWAVFSGGTDYYYHNERVAIQEEVRWRLDDQQRKLVQGVSTQYSQLEATRARLAAGYKELAAISEAARAMGERMLAGNTSLMDLLDVLERLYQTRSRMVALHAQELIAGAQLGRYLGYPEWTAGESAADGRAKP
jgi:adhesin transport system outer membrane protein